MFKAVIRRNADGGIVMTPHFASVTGLWQRKLIEGERIDDSVPVRHLFKLTDAGRSLLKTISSPTESRQCPAP